MISTRAFCCLLILVLLPGCGFGPLGKDRSTSKRGERQISDLVADLPELRVSAEVAAKPSRAEVLAAYERVYGLIDDRIENHAVGKRLADLKMGVGEDRDIAGAENPYQDAVTLYESLLETSEGEDKDQILYQLARAHDLVGDTDATVSYLNRLIDNYPESPFLPEARFRRAEIEFSAGQYRAAQADYGYVVSKGNTTPYLQNAIYMQGWAQFKLGDLEAGLSSFFLVVDNVLTTTEGMDPETLALTEREILDDSLRVVTLALAYLDGAETLAQHMRSLARPEWQYQIYEALADDYLEKERYLDSVATWHTFIAENSLDARAPSAHIGMIDTLIQADFPSEVKPKKEEFVARYGIYSQFWSIHEATVRDSYVGTLHEYLTELATIAHGEAQDSKTATDYLKAANWYEEIVLTFPEDPRTAEYLFLLGEVYTEAQEHGRAVAAFQQVVHEFLDYDRADEAGYAAILGLEALVATAPRTELELWQRLKIDAQIEFAILFSADERASAVQGAAADSLFALNEYEQAVDLASNLLATWPDVSGELKKTALLILGHGLFELEDYVAAEQAYHRLLAVELRSDEQLKVEERLLASVYKQAEASESTGDVDGAIAHYLRLKEIDPNATLAIQGQFDAVAVIEEAGRISEAAVLLNEFRASYPDHELGADIEQRLAAMYEHTEDWSSAALEYVALAGVAADPEVRRQSQYRAAELYLMIDDVSLAIASFQTYADSYEHPLALNLEAVDHLDHLYQRIDDPRQRRVWLERKIDIHRAMGSAATERATFLAAEAQYVFAEDERLRFDDVRLTHPLNKSLQRKQKALTRTLAAFEAVAEYQVAKYSTASTYQIADLYTSLSSSIMGSARPADLSELELEQYEILLEEQAFPFEEQAISLHEINMRRSWEGVYDEWVKKSFTELGRLMPARFDKQEIEVAYVETIH
jgi:tetratricopeptide (TPR) repeat protein